MFPKEARFPRGFNRLDLRITIGNSTETHKAGMALINAHLENIDWVTKLFQRFIIVWRELQIRCFLLGCPLRDRPTAIYKHANTGHVRPLPPP